MADSIPDRTIAEVQRLLERRDKKEKISVSLSGEIIRAADAIAGKAQRSAFVERAVRRYLRTILRRARDKRDLEAINARARVTNRESDRVLDIQAWPE